jgi:tetratricopeptide (TPR) repeat protein
MKSNSRTTKPAKARASSSAGENPGWKLSLSCALVGAVTCAIFLPAAGNDFLNWDDDTILTNNLHYRGFGWQHLRWMFTTVLMGHYQPLTWLSFALDYAFWGMDPFGYHLTNVILHTAGATLFCLVSYRLLAVAMPEAQSSGWLAAGAAFAALLFAIHPLRVESVAWATERRDVLSGVFYFSTLYCYLRVAGSAHRDARVRWLSAALVTYLLSLLSKATAMTLPAVLFLLDVYPLKRLPLSPRSWLRPEFRGVILEKFPFLALAVMSGAVALTAQHATGALKPLDQFDWLSRLLQASLASMFYLYKTFFPFNLSPIYELPVDSGGWFWLCVLSGIAAVFVTVTLVLCARRYPAVLAAWAYYLIVLAPMTGIAQSGPQLVADRYSYLSCLSWPLLVAGGFVRVLSPQTARRAIRSALPLAAAAMLVAVAAVLTWEQNRIWRTPKALWLHATRVTPDSSIAHYNLGRTLEREAAWAQAIESYRRAVTVNPSHAKAHLNLAALLSVNGAEGQAIEHYKRALEIRPDHADAHNNLGLLLENAGDLDGASRAYHAAIELDPNHPKSWYNLAGLAAKRGNLDQAALNYQRAARVDPDAFEIQIGLGITLARQGRLEAATPHFIRAVELKPDAADNHLLLARALAAQGKSAEAERHYQEALRLLKTTAKSPAEPLHVAK